MLAKIGMAIAAALAFIGSIFAIHRKGKADARNEMYIDAIEAQKEAENERKVAVDNISSASDDDVDSLLRSPDRR